MYVKRSLKFLIFISLNKKHEIYFDSHFFFINLEDKYLFN